MKKIIYTLIIAFFCFAIQIKIQAQTPTVVGCIPGKFNVGSSGAATYSIPIDCPAGINGVQPNISLEYNSQGGDGVCGIGWNIGGLSSITLATQNIFSDNALSGIKLNNDAYIMDGVKLHLITGATPYTVTDSKFYANYPTAIDINTQCDIIYNATKNLNGSTYESEHKDFSRIYTTGVIPYVETAITKENVNNNPGWRLTWTVYSAGPRKFIVTTKDGRTIEYSAARNVNALTKDNAKSANFEWVVSKISDANANFMTFSYKVDEGQTIIRKIEYTGHGSILPSDSIVFNYSTKTIVKETGYGDVHDQNRYRLDNIQVKSGTTVLKQYDLSYAYRIEKYYMEGITLTGLNSRKLNSTGFSWGTDNTNMSVNTITTPVPYSQQTVDKTSRYWLSADMTGDGIDDVINIYPAKIADQNGIMQTKDYVQVFKTTVNNGQISLTNDAYYDLGTGLNYDMIKDGNPNVLLGDINGDGKKEIVVSELDLSNGAKIKFKIAGGATYDYSLQQSQLPLVVLKDINNDRIDEIIYLEKTSIYNYSLLTDKN